jgi:hypothetical protein
MPRIYDCIVIQDELDLLDKRFTALAEVPGLIHVICEAPVTPGGEPKPLFFWANRNTRYACWHGRWNHVRVEEHEISGNTPEERLASLREYLLHGVHGGPDDIIICGDIQEIPDPGMLTELAYRRTLPPAGGSCYRRDVSTMAGIT